jgi:ferric-dicitrate binding protein FerR (iron transport regulator)
MHSQAYRQVMDAAERHRAEREKRAVFYRRWEAEDRRLKRRIVRNAVILAVLVAVLVTGLLMGWGR